MNAWRHVQILASVVGLAVLALLICSCGGGMEPGLPEAEPLPVPGEDTDGDGLLDTQEYLFGTNLRNPDTDGDGIDDYTQVIVMGSIPPPTQLRLLITAEDSDGDGLSDTEEEEYGTDPNDVDTDHDGLTDSYEVLDWGGYQTSPLDPDADRDGLLDGREVWWACDPHKGDTDRDGIIDKDEIDLPIGDPYKGDGCPYTKESIDGKDSDRDGIPVGAEGYEVHTDPRLQSTDGDRYPDGMEYLGHDFYSGEDLPAYVGADPFTSATPDIVIEVVPEVKLNLAQTLKMGNKTLDRGEHTYTVDKSDETKTTEQEGIEASIVAKAGYPPWKGSVEATVKVYANYRYESSSSTALRTQDKDITAEEIYQMEEVDLSGSHLQVWINIVNAGNDILSAPLKEITLNLYLGDDENPFHTESLKEVFTNIAPGRSIPLTLNIPINLEQLQRFTAGEAVEVRVAHFSFGEDQVYLERAKAMSIVVEVNDGASIMKYYVSPRDAGTLSEVLTRIGVDVQTSEGGEAIASINGMTIQTGQLPYRWWSIYFQINGRDISTRIQDTPLEAGDYVLLKYEIDSDGDMLADREEFHLGTRIDEPDTDDDGLSDGDTVPELGLMGEKQFGTHPLLSDTDADGCGDKVEVDDGTDPLSPTSFRCHAQSGGGDDDVAPGGCDCPPGYTACEEGVSCYCVKPPQQCR